MYLPDETPATDREEAATRQVTARMSAEERATFYRQLSRDLLAQLTTTQGERDEARVVAHYHASKLDTLTHQAARAERERDAALAELAALRARMARAG